MRVSFSTRSSLLWSAAPLALAAAAVAVPWLLTHGFPAIAIATRGAFALVCHQRPERCFWIAGFPVAVCARCLGIYLGAAVGLLIRTSRHAAMKLLIVASTLNLFDFLAEFSGLHGNWLYPRFFLGLALGLAATMVIASCMPIASHAAPSRRAAL